MAEHRDRVLGNTGATVNIVNPTRVRIPEDKFLSRSRLVKLSEKTHPNWEGGHSKDWSPELKRKEQAS